MGFLGNRGSKASKASSGTKYGSGKYGSRKPAVQHTVARQTVVRFDHKPNSPFDRLKGK